MLMKRQHTLRARVMFNRPISERAARRHMAMEGHWTQFLDEVNTTVATKLKWLLSETKKKPRRTGGR